MNDDAISSTKTNALLSIRARRESATEITEFMARTLAQPDLVSLAVGFVDQISLPRLEVAHCVESLLSDRDRGLAALQYGTTIGLDPLRREVARRLHDGGLDPSVGADDILITNGSQQLLYLVTDVLANPGDIVLVEDPTYFAYGAVLKGAAARAMGIPTDEQGILPDVLEGRLDSIEQAGEIERVKILYVMTYFSNPRGTSVSWERREAIHDIIRRRTRPILIVEDAAYRELQFEGEPIPYLKSLDCKNEIVLLAGSFSKSFAPGLRSGFAAVPKWLMHHLITQKTYHDFGAPNFAQAVLLEALQSGAFDQHLTELAQRYRSKRDLALRVISEAWPAEVRVTRPQGGMHLWAALPEKVSTDVGQPLFEAAVEDHRVLYIPGSLCYVDDPTRPRPQNEMRICYGMIDDENLVEGLKRLGGAIKSVLARD